MRRRNSLMRLGMDSFWLGVEANSVIALRLMKLAQGGSGATAEAERMVAEKLRAAAETQVQVIGSVMSGQGHLAAGRAVTAYRRKVRANRRRLAKG